MLLILIGSVACEHSPDALLTHPKSLKSQAFIAGIKASRHQGITAHHPQHEFEIAGEYLRAHIGALIGEGSCEKVHGPFQHFSMPKACSTVCRWINIIPALEQGDSASPRVGIQPAHLPNSGIKGNGVRVF